jgi:3-isopropylmalate dehydrogenase
MMLDWLGHRHDDASCREVAVIIEHAVARVIEAGSVRTPDLGGDATTMQVAQAVANEVAVAAEEV